jgi:phosphoenolpyruvate-protein kinase (PTS system EI component)
MDLDKEDTKKALRVIYATLLWHLNLVEDAMTAALELKFLREKEEEEEKVIPKLLEEFLKMFNGLKDEMKERIVDIEKLKDDKKNAEDKKKEDDEKKKKEEEEEEERNGMF